MSNRRIGITGSRGFIAGHLARSYAPAGSPIAVGSSNGIDVVPCPRDAWDDAMKLEQFVRNCDTVVHLAGVNRGDERLVYDTNVGLVNRLIESLEACDRAPHVIFASSAQRDRPGAYGRSKKYGEDRLKQWAMRSASRLTTLMIPNVFGPGCRPFYNSVVATFCHQLAHGQQPVIIDDQAIELVWINDLIAQLRLSIEEPPATVCEGKILGSARLTVSQLLEKLDSIRASYFDDNVVPDLSDALDAQLYTTFLSHIDLDDHCHRPRVHADDRGQLCEILRLVGGGQVFVSSTKPGVIRGNHFHTRKVEWFCVLRGDAVIRLRRVGDDQVREFRVSGGAPQFISIPALHTHQIENIGADELLTMFWCNEIFQPADPDTFIEQVA